MIFGTGYGSKYAFRIALTGMILTLCLCVSSWGACIEGSFGEYDYYGPACFGGSSLPVCGFPNDGTCFTEGYYNNICLCSATSFSSCPQSTFSNGYYVVGPYAVGNGMTNCGSNNSRSTCYYQYRCSTQAEADSVANSLGPEEDVPANCMDDYNECMLVAGVWEKIGSDAGGCLSTCNMCNSKQQIRNKNRWKNICCALGEAPPPDSTVCVPPVVPSGYGMSTSRLLTSDGETTCGKTQTADGQLITENAELFNRYCLEGEEYEEEADTNDVGGSSSSAGGGESSSGASSSFSSELDALGGIYGVLDTIRDTLDLHIKPAIDEIRDCLYSFRLCAQLDSIKIDWSNMPKDSSWLYIDTAILKYIKPLMDSSLALDSNQLKALRKLDTNALKQLRLDSAGLSNDTATRRAINGGFDGVLKNDTATRKAIRGVDSTVVSLDSSIRRGVRDGVDSLIDSMSKYMAAVGDSIGSVGGPGSPLGDSLGHILGVLGGIDSALSGNGMALGEQGYSSYGSDSSGYVGVLQGAYGEGEGAGDSAYAIEPDSCTSIECMGPHIDMDSVERVVRANLDSNYQVIADSSEGWFTAIRENLKFVDFDSVLVQPLQSVVPNTNTCPADCFKISISNNAIPGVSSIDYGVCKSWNVGGVAVNALIIVRLILRIITAVTCIYIGLWYIAGRKN